MERLSFPDRPFDASMPLLKQKRPLPYRIIVPGHFTFFLSANWNFPNCRQESAEVSSSSLVVLFDRVYLPLFTPPPEQIDLFQSATILPGGGGGGNFHGRRWILRGENINTKKERERSLNESLKFILRVELSARVYLQRAEDEKNKGNNFILMYFTGWWNDQEQVSGFSHVPTSSWP